jgi:LacI family transcriptional regulator, galactose operon repressor
MALRSREDIDRPGAAENAATRHRRRTGRVSLAEVARVAGVSAMTVSRVVNGTKSVGDEARQSVGAAIRQLGYCPHPAARSLALARLERIAVLHDDPRAASLSRLLIGVLEESNRTSAQILVRRIEPQKESAQRIVRKLVADGVAGVILPPPLGDVACIRAALHGAGLPTVAVSAGAACADTMHVGIDERGAAYELTKHLLALGHRRIGFIKGPPEWSASGERWAGFAAALTEDGMEASQSPVAQGQCTYRSGIEAARILLEARPALTAIFASCDQMAAATIAVAHHRGLQVPAAITVVGCDDSPAACAIWPEVTTVRRPISAMAAEAVDMLIGAIRAARSGRPPECHKRLIDHHLVLRASASSPPSPA